MTHETFTLCAEKDGSRDKSYDKAFTTKTCSLYLRNSGKDKGRRCTNELKVIYSKDQEIILVSFKENKRQFPTDRAVSRISITKTFGFELHYCMYPLQLISNCRKSIIPIEATLDVKVK